jgi:hypothetical protein
MNDQNMEAINKELLSSMVECGLLDKDEPNKKMIKILEYVQQQI